MVNKNPFKQAYFNEYGISTLQKDGVKAGFQKYTKNKASQNILNPCDVEYDSWPANKQFYINSKTNMVQDSKNPGLVDIE
jgi:hypothetical protein